MSEEYEGIGLMERLAKIRSTCDVVKKSKQGYGYSYADISEILAKVTAGMKKWGVSLIPSINPSTSKVNVVTTVNTKFDKTGKSYDASSTEMMFTADMTFRWLCNDKPEDFIDIPWFVTGSQSDPSQAMGSGLTYTQRQFLTAFFQIAQDNDVDGYRTKRKEAEEAENTEIASKIMDVLNDKIREYIAANPEKKDGVIALYKKHIKTKTVKDPEIASNALKDFTDTYLGGNE